MIRYRKRTDTKRIILHASHTLVTRPNVEAYLEANGRRMGLLEIGYHFLILQDGALKETRPHTSQGSHTPGFNKDSIGVCLEGGMALARNDAAYPVEYEEVPFNTFTEAQWATLRWLVEHLRGAYGTQLPLVGHTELGRHRHRANPCPPVNMNTIRKDLEL